jgi:aspartyl-tRNA(Asn)/glutamyl-tRNA(Gln) amidotransferase subunit B
MDYDVIIGFEIHAELKTDTKLFCDCEVTYGAPQNTHICPLCTGQPGSLPVLNKKAVEFCVRAGLAMNCSINRYSLFARKNYFYPDLPKGYQISQYELPLCENGYIIINGDDGEAYPVGIKRIHLEEDAGKLVHSSESISTSEYSLIDYNRSGIPLIEIVTDHTTNPMRSVKEARNYLEKIRQILRYIEVSDCTIEKGQFRCDVNISLKKKGSPSYSNRAEIKNMTSFKFISEALEYEIKRQSKLLKEGKKIEQETRLYNEEKKITLPMRSKEDAPDYRYFPDPDLIELELEKEFIDKIRKTNPVLPDELLNLITEKYKVSQEDAYLLARNKEIANFFTECAPHSTDNKKLARWIINNLLKHLEDNALTIESVKIEPKDFAVLINLIVKGEITDRVGKTVLEEMISSGKSPEVIINEKGLKPIEDTKELNKFVDDAFNAHPEIIEQLKSGETKAVNVLIGQVMRSSKGKANANKLRELILERIEKE